MKLELDLELDIEYISLLFNQDKKNIRPPSPLWTNDMNICNEPDNEMSIEEFNNFKENHYLWIKHNNILINAVNLKRNNLIRYME